MKVDRGGGKFIGDSPRSGKETSIQKKGGKVKLNAGEEDEVRISQDQNSLKLQINQSSYIHLTPEESKNLEVKGGGKISVDSNVTIPIKGLPSRQESQSMTRSDVSAVSIQKEEAEWTEKITRKIFNSEFPVALNGEQTSIKPPASDIRESNPVETGRINRNETENFVPEEAASMSENSSSARKEETKFSAAITQNHLISELGDSELAPFQSKSKSVAKDISTFHSELQGIEKQQAGQNKPGNGVAPQQQVEGNSISKMDAKQFGAIEFASASFNDPSALARVKGQDSQEKSDVLKSVLDRPMATKSDEIVQSVLFSAKTPDEFNQIVNKVGARSLIDSLQTDESRGRWDQLAGAYDRMDIAIDPTRAEKTRGLLMMEIEVHASSEPLLLETDVANPPLDLNSLDRSATVCLAIENAVRDKEGKPLLSAGEMREKVLEILTEQTSSQIPLSLEILRNDQGLTNFQMREIVSLPLAEVFQTAVQDLSNLRSSKLELFQHQLQDAIQVYGQESVAVEICKTEQSEFVSSMEPKIQQFAELKSAALEIFLGPANPLSIADQKMHLLLNAIPAAAPQVTSMLDHLAKGASLFEPAGLQKSAETVARIQVPDLKEFANQASSFFQALPGFIPIAPQIQGFHAFEFLDRVHSGAWKTQMTDLKRALEEFGKLPAVQQNTAQLNRWKNDFHQSVSPGQQEGLFRQGEKILSDLAGGALIGRWLEIHKGSQNLKLDSRITDVIESVQMAGDLIVSFRNGRYVQLLAALNQRMAGSPAVLQIIQQALHLTTTGSNFFRGLMNRHWEKPVAQAIRKSPANKELKDAESIFSGALNFFLPLESIDNLTPFIQYHRQLALLRDESVMRDLIHMVTSQ